MRVTDDAASRKPRTHCFKMSAMTFSTILIPTDLSEFSRASLRWASLLERRLGAKLTLLYANQPWVSFDVVEGPATYLMQNSPEFKRTLADEVRDYVARNLPDLTGEVDTRVVDKEPSQAILETADAIDADLVVMGTHGRTGWRRALIGSVAEKVVRHSQRPVLCIPPGAEEIERPTLAKILCPVNFTPIARLAVEEAAAIADAFDAELLLVHVTDHIDEAVDVAGEFDAWIEPHVRNRCRYSHIVSTGNAAEETIRMAQETGADLIVIGAQHKRFADDTVIGTTTERVIRSAKRPVLAVPAPVTGDAKKKRIQREEMVGRAT
jgi:nucleotide-binding universal stress UspA family protein